MCAVSSPNPAAFYRYAWCHLTHIVLCACCRSLHGSTRVSYSEAPNTPTGSSQAPSAPGSNISSAPNSGRDGGANALAAAAAAGTAAAASAALRRQHSADAYSRGVGASDPGTPTGAGMFGGGTNPASSGRVQVVGGSVPTSGSSTSSGGGGSSGTQPGSASSPGPMAGPSELSFAMARPAPLLTGQPALGPPCAGPGQTSPAGAALRTPSRLGPSRCSSTMASPTAMTAGMAVLQEVQPGLEHGGGAADASGAGRATYAQRRNSGGTAFAGQQSPTHAGSRLRRLSWGTLEGSLQSSGSAGSKQLGLPLSRGSWGGSVVHEYPPATTSQPAGEQPYSPFSAVQAPSMDGATQGAFAAQDAAVAVLAAGAAAAGTSFSSSSSPYPTLLAPTSTQQGACGGVVVPAPAAAAVAAPARPRSPFAAVQQQPAEDTAATAEAAAAAQPAAALVTSLVPGRPCSPFAAAQRQSTGDGTPGVSAGTSTELMTSRQGTDDSVAAAQPPARPSSPFSALQAAAEPLTARAAGVAPVAVVPAGVGADQWPSPRPHSPFAAVQEHPEAGPSLAPAATVAAAAGQQGGPPPAAAGAAARPHSPFAAAQQLQECGPDNFRAESLTGSPFASLALQHSGASSSGSCPGPGAVAVAGVHAPSRRGAAGQAHVGPQAALLQQQQQPQQQQSLAGEQPWRPPSPFAGVQVAAVQGPIVAQQARTVLAQLNPQRSAQEQGPPHMQHAAVSAGSPRGAAAAGNDTAYAPLASFLAQGQGQQPRLQALTAAAAAAAPAHDNGGFPGSSGDSITFPSGLGAVESVVFLRNPTKRTQSPQ